jgi:PhzF family phenazine biosynthesis protein
MKIEPIETYKSRDYLLVYDSEEQIKSLSPNMHILSKVDCFAIIATAKGDSSDFVSRFFAPAVGVPEDPVTGSAHSTLIPFWAKKLSKNKLQAKQLSERGGELHCTNLKDRVLIAGNCHIHMEGNINIE